MLVLLLSLLPACTTQATVNPRLFSFSSYIGPVVNLTFDDTAILKVVETLNIGSMRYPGGSPSNHWNITSGRWIDSQHDFYANRTAALPIGTFTPAKYMAGLGGLLKAPPIWNMNIYSMEGAEMLAQLDTLKAMEVPVKYIELGNELAGGCGDADYLAKLPPFVKHAREVFPNAQIAIIGSWGSSTNGPSNWDKCAQTLKEHSFLFDAITVHQYEPTNVTLSKYPEDLQMSVQLISPQAILKFHEDTVKKNIGNIPIWLDEFNWGGNWAGPTTWPTQIHGPLRGIFWASFVLQGLARSETFQSLNYYSLFEQDGVPWTPWASCVHVSGQANKPDEIGMDATSQIFAHFAQIALGTDKTARNTQQLNFSSEMLGRQVELYGLTEFSCVIGSMFWTDNNNNGRSYVLVNACPNAVQGVLAWNGAQTTSVNVNITSYEATQKFNSANHWVPLNQIENIMSPPWNNGPLQPFISSGKYYVRDGNVMNITLSALSLTIIQAKI
eukprot:m.77504 g.77504  ORF g.77504 m.77504 type:complete len:498 (+) comp12629_c0_seq6:181-1674(+)